MVVDTLRGKISDLTSADSDTDSNECVCSFGLAGLCGRITFDDTVCRIEFAASWK